MNTSDVMIVTYSQGVLQKIIPFFELHSNITIVDEKTPIDFSNISQLDEVWIDAYVDLYDPRLIDPCYLYHFFLRLQEILNNIDKNSFKPTIRLLLNFYHHSTYSELNKIFLLYQSFTAFLLKAYDLYAVFIPDILDSSYKYHPYHQIAYKNLLWNRRSLFRVIHPNDIVYNLLEEPLQKSDYVITGLKVGLADMCDKVYQIFGNKPASFDEAYLIEVDDNITGILLSEYHYNLETICMLQIT